MLLAYSHNVIFANCSFYANIGTPIWSYNSNFTLSGTVLFSDNTAYEGGALAFYGESAVYISNNTNVTFLNNTAENVGGAIFVRNPLPYVTHSCFLQFIGTSSQCSRRSYCILQKVKFCVSSCQKYRYTYAAAINNLVD